MRRNPQITLRIPEATTIGRVKGFNRPQVERFYKPLSEQITKIYNIDESGTRTSTNKPPVVLSVKGKKQVVVISSLNVDKLRQSRVPAMFLDYSFRCHTFLGVHVKETLKSLRCFTYKYASEVRTKRKI